MIDYKSFEFDDISRTSVRQYSVSFYFTTVEEGYAICFNAQHDETNLTISMIDINSSNSTLFYYSLRHNHLMTSPELNKTNKVIDKNINNDDIFILSVYLGAYKRKTDGKAIPEKIINQSYELLNCIYNEQPFKVSLNNNAWVYFNGKDNYI